MGHPALFLCIAALVVNDHVLKDLYPNWWTGKLSDFAGLAVIGIVLAAAIGPRRGITVAGIAFSLLKLVPGVAEAAAPVLGGVTRRDPSDLLALSVLVPIWLAMRPRIPTRVLPDQTRGTPVPRLPAIWAGVRTTLATVAPIVGLVFATAATTATSCAPKQAVVTVTADGRNLFALVATNAVTERWVISEDGGRTWQGTESPSRASSTSPSVDIYDDPGPTGPQEACASDGTCWRLRDRRSIERIAPDGTAVEEFRMTDKEFSDIRTGCAGGSIGVLATIASTDGDGDSDGDGGVHVVAGLGADGVLVRQEDGGWEQVRVLSAPPVEASGPETAASGALFLFGPAVALVVWLVGRRRWQSWRKGLVVVAAGWLATMEAASFFSMIAGPDTDFARSTSRVGVPGIILTTVAAIIVARRPARARPPSIYPAAPPATFPPPPPTTAGPRAGEEG